MYEFIVWCNKNQGFVTVVLTVLTVAISLIALVVSTRVEKKIHNRDVVLSFHQKVLEIYNAFCETVRVFQFDDSMLGAKLGLVTKPGEQIIKMLEQRIIIERTLDEANLFFCDDTELMTMLKNLADEFFKLSEQYIEATQKAVTISACAFETIKQEFPKLMLQGQHELTKILTDCKATERFNQLYTTSETKALDAEIAKYCEKFYCEKYDEAFRKHLLLKKL